MTPKERADIIRALMAGHKMTMRRLERLTGLSYHTIRNLLDGKHAVKYEPTLQKVENALGVKAKSLI